MKMTDKQYNEYVKSVSPNSPMGKNILKAFLVGGIICCIGEAIKSGYMALGFDKELSATATSITLVFIGAILTGLGVYDKIAKHAGAGTLVPITGFANSVVAPALEFKSEGTITGTAAKMFIISGPVLVFGTVAGVLYGIAIFIMERV